MAKSSWCTTDPASGSGNGTVNVDASAHTGRNQRTATLTFKATGVADNAVSVTQLAKSEFVTISDVSIGKIGGTVTVSGATNSSKLTFSLGSGDILITPPESYSAGGATTTNGAAVVGDPGATAQFDLSIQFTIPANATIEDKSRTVTVTANGGQSASAVISQAAGDPALSVSPSNVSLEAKGTAKAVSVKSNTNWSVS